MSDICYKWLGNDIFVSYSSPVYLDDLNFFHENVYGDPKFDSMKMQYVVFNDGACFKASESEMDCFSYIEEAAAKSNPYPIYVIIVLKSDDPVLRQTMEGYVEFSKRYGWQSHIFESDAEALNWLQGEGVLGEEGFEKLERQTKEVL